VKGARIHSASFVSGLVGQGIKGLAALCVDLFLCIDHILMEDAAVRTNFAARDFAPLEQLDKKRV